MTRKQPNRGRQAATKLAARDTAKLVSFRSTLRRARFNKSMGTFADKEFATKDSRVKAAYAEAKRRAGTAWKLSEFQTALQYAQTYKIMEPLAKLLESEASLMRSDRLALGSFVRSLETPKVGRPRGPLSGDVNVAQRNAVYWVRLGQQAWLKKNNRQRVPASVTEDLIAEAICLALKAFNQKLSFDDIRALVNKASRKIID